VPVACAAALALADRALLRARWKQVLGPVFVAFLVGVALLWACRTVDQQHDPNGWYENLAERSVGQKFYLRSLLLSPRFSMELGANFLLHVLMSSAYLLLAMAAVVLVNFILEKCGFTGQTADVG